MMKFVFTLLLMIPFTTAILLAQDNHQDKSADYLSKDWKHVACRIPQLFD